MTLRAVRIGVTDRCSYRCRYCVLPSFRRLLSVADHRRVAQAFAGVSAVEFSGGEPLLRPDLAALVAAYRDALPTARLSLATNGLLLGAHLAALEAAGLDRVVVHVDTLRPERYRAVMGGRDLPVVLGHLLRAREVLGEAALAFVVQRGINDDELLDVLAYSARHRVGARFVELEPATDPRAVPGAELVTRLGAEPLAGRWALDGVAFEIDAGRGLGRNDEAELDAEGT